MEIWENVSARKHVDLGELPPPDRGPLAYHRHLPGYAPTPLRSAPDIAERLGVAEVLVKDEAVRFALPSYKILGASWAVYRRLAELGLPVEPWTGPQDVRARLAETRRTLVAATDGNHGRAVARMADLLGFDARIYIPDDMVPARITGIEGEGAEVVVVDGGYDLAVDTAAKLEDATTIVISDTAYPGYDRVPRWVSEGYSTIFWEIDDALDQCLLPRPTVVAVQMGVGALAAAVVRHYRGGGDPSPPQVVGVEPDEAACVLAAARAGRMVELPGPQRSIMAGLNCGRASSVALPLLVQGVDRFVALDDEAAREAMRALAAAGVVAGESGSAGLAGMMALAEDGRLASDDRVLIVNTEGATDPEAYEQIVGRAVPAL